MRGAQENLPNFRHLEGEGEEVYFNIKSVKVAEKLDKVREKKRAKN